MKNLFSEALFYHPVPSFPRTTPLSLLVVHTWFGLFLVPNHEMVVVWELCWCCGWCYCISRERNNWNAVIFKSRLGDYSCHRVCTCLPVCLKSWACSFKILKEKGRSLRDISELAPCILKAHITVCGHDSKLGKSWTILWHWGQLAQNSQHPYD